MTDSFVVSSSAEPVVDTPRKKRPSSRARSVLLVQVGSVVGFLIAWHVASLFSTPLFLPGPILVGQKAWNLLLSGELLSHVAISELRIIAGWAIGGVIAAPLGLLAGRVRIARAMLEPYTNFFRFVPPISFVTLSLIWLGIGEASKIALIVYTSAFIIFVNAMVGSQGVPVEQVRAARSMGANRRQLARYVIIPSALPFVITAARLAMGSAFMTVVAAELVTASSGVGYLIFNSRLYGETSVAFVGVFCLGMMGLGTDALLRFILRRASYRFAIKF